MRGTRTSLLIVALATASLSAQSSQPLPQSLTQMIEAEKAFAARALVEDLGARAALVKGGDLEGEILIDAFCQAVEGGSPRVHLFRDRRIETTRTHGSGCALASAIAAYLARGEPLFEAVAKGRAWVRRGIESAPPLGGGRGPLDLFPRA